MQDTDFRPLRTKENRLKQLSLFNDGRWRRLNLVEQCTSNIFLWLIRQIQAFKIWLRYLPGIQLGTCVIRTSLVEHFSNTAPNGDMADVRTSLQIKKNKRVYK